MNVEKLLRDKGAFVATVKPDTPVSEALAALARHQVGALVVSLDGHTVAGIVSERDVVRHLHTDGGPVLQGEVGTIMSSDVRFCAPGDTLESLMEVMTAHRIRHVPVVEEGALVGIVSIGDVVKARLGELEDDRQALHDYINAR
ncbi:MAG: CBS domain-containing protein [Actinomycetota bacterium]|nr:CBS domain-containing protein [Actinomycetota bacterium]